MKYCNHTRVRVVCGDLNRLLNKLYDSEIEIHEVEYVDELTADISILTSKLKSAVHIFEKESTVYKLLTQSGSIILSRLLLKRSVLIVGVCLIVLMALYLQGKVLFVKVSGNDRLPSNEILEYAAQCGISFGASTRQLRSEKVKNALLEKMNSLQWVGINTNGCVVTIQVREKTIDESVEQLDAGGSDIIAVRDGVILDLTATNGETQCTVGQAVLTGQVLISGYSNVGNVLKICHASGDVLAQTRHQLMFVSPNNYQYRGNQTKTVVRYSMLIGHKLINFYNNSGICDESCVKMYEKFDVVVPGGHTLPVALIKETLYYYDQKESIYTDTQSHDWLLDYSREYLKSIMIAGSIKREEFSFTCTQFACKIEASYLCNEMIGRRFIQTSQ